MTVHSVCTFVMTIAASFAMSLMFKDAHCCSHPVLSSVVGDSPVKSDLLYSLQTSVEGVKIKSCCSERRRGFVPESIKHSWFRALMTSASKSRNAA